MNLIEICGITLPKRHNTRRNRQRALRRYFNQDDARFANVIPHPSAIENQCICGAHIADFIDRGGTLKAYSAWSGCRVRELSRWLDDFRRHRFPGQRMLKGGGK
jgi:hypothetical protein